MESIVIIKVGALGDVVRTSYFAEAITKKYNYPITWISSKESMDILRFNPFIDKILSIENEPPKNAAMVISLEDDLKYVQVSSKIETNKLTGSYISNGDIRYTGNASEWFDMGLISRFGKSRADTLKKENTSSHAEIFQRMFNVKLENHIFYGNKYLQSQWSIKRSNVKIVIGLIPFSGLRWPSKEMPYTEFLNLLLLINKYLSSKIDNSYELWIFCDDTTVQRASELYLGIKNIKIVNTGCSLHYYASAIYNCDYIISTDSLGLHLAIGQNIPNLSYYCPTSAVEIDTFNIGVKVLSNSVDYCSYRPQCDNTSLTSHRIFDSWIKHFELYFPND